MLWNFIKTKSSVIIKGILWGALFFCLYPLSAQSTLNAANEKDEPVLHDSTRLMLKTIRERKRMVSDTLSDNSDSTIIVLNDSLVIRNDSLVIRNDSVINEHDTLLIKNDTLTVLDQTTLSKSKNFREHSPPRATILSAVVPGLGQAYNRKYWKIPIIYAAGTGLYLWFDYANGIYNKYKTIYETELAKGDEGDQVKKNNASLYRDAYSTYRGYAVIFMGLLYVANVVDAMVDAYFLKFDVSDDLSLRVEPYLDPVPYQYAFNNLSYGVKLSVKF